ncbi:hypothetical protein [Cereibacter azotoformans]|uniref:hypothetical protein n=1 Tax=Cereibacter azotoformans TaxID=43057 RepID=UPI000C6D95CC|nr:hypothetical protein [Cereibacter azotoformans]
MPLLTATDAWQTHGPTTAEEVWQCREGMVLITLEAVVNDDQGLELVQGDSLVIASGKTVRYRTRNRGIINREVTG